MANNKITERPRGAQIPFALRPELEAKYPTLAAFHAAMRTKSVLLPNGDITHIDPTEVAFSTDTDAWTDHVDVVMQPEYAQTYACILETIVNAGLCSNPGKSVASGTKRFEFILRNLSSDRATGDLFGFRCYCWERDGEIIDWRKERTVCDAFTAHPNQCLNKLKKKIYAPCEGLVQSSEHDLLLLRLGYVGLAVKLFLARTGHPQFCPQARPQN